MKKNCRIRQASEIQSLYEAPDIFDDQESESETEDVFEEQYSESDEEENEEEQVEDDESESSENGDSPQVKSQSGKRKRSRPSYLRGKNGFKWSLDPPDIKSERPRPAYTAAPKGRAKKVKTPLEAWSIFFDDEILKIILKYTNEEISRNISDFREKKIQIKLHHRETDLDELRAVIGLLYFSGLHKSNHSSVDSLWSLYGMSLFKITMSANRFKFLILCLRFDNKSTRCRRKAIDPFTNIREIWEKFIKNCKNNYEPDSQCTLNEQLLSFRGKCCFKMYLPAKPDKYGLKVVTLNDATTHYLVNAVPYCGTVINKNPTESVQSYCVKRLAEPIYKTGRNITCDNWFTSISICDELLDKWNLTMVGKIHKSEREIPSSFKTVKFDEKIKFAYNNKKILVSFNPKAEKNVLLLSSYHDGARIDSESGIPEIVMFYNSTNGGTDNFNKKCHDYTTARKTLRWPMRYFYAMLDQANVNSFIIYNLIGSNKTMVRHDYILDLSLSLIKPFLIKQLQLPTLQMTLRSQIKYFLEFKDSPDAQDPRDLIVDNKMEKYKRCGYCPSSIDRKTCYKCLTCDVPMCKEHTAKICAECSIQLCS